jgi:hypothetical protein
MSIEMEDGVGEVERDSDPEVDDAESHVSIDGDAVCPHCGSSLLHPSARCDHPDNDEDTVSTKGSDEPPAKPVKKEKAVVAPKRMPRAPPNPLGLRFRVVRRTVHVQMLACIPGVNRAMARKLLDAAGPNLANLLHAPISRLENVKIGRHVVLGNTLATAVKRVLAE